MSGACNQRPNELGQMYPYAEYEKDHGFKTFRHFPLLRTSISNIEMYQKTAGRDMHSRYNPSLQPIQRSVQLKYTHKLEELSKSSIGDIVSMDDFRKVLIAERNKQKKIYGDLTGGSSILSLSKKGSGSSLLGSLKGLGSLSKLGTIGGDEGTVNTTRYSVVDLETANQKLAKVALSYNALSVFNVLKGFQGAKMNLKEFNAQLKRCININLTKGELEAMFKSMDVDDSSTIEPVEFTRYFLDLGNKVRQETRLEVLQKFERRRLEEKQKRIDSEAELERWRKEQVQSFTSDDAEIAMQKLSEVALTWDNSNFIDAICCSGFQSHLTPYEFKTQIEKSFGIRLTKGESGALLEKFSTREGEYCIDGELFLKHFTQLKLHERRKDHDQRLKMGHRKRNMVPYIENSQSAFLGR